jgi:hypothetical protein
MNAMAQAMQLRAMQESSQMNALKAQEYQRNVQQRNALTRIHSDPNLKPGSPEYLTRVQQEVPDLFESVAARTQQRAELDEKIEARRIQNFDRKFNLFKSIVPTITSVDGVSKYVAAAYQDPDLAPVLSQIRPYEEAIKANLDAFNADPETWRLNAAGVSAKDIADMARNKAKDEQPVVVVPGGRLVSRTGEELYAAPDREKESELARLQRERADIAKADAADPRLKDYDAAIAKATATNSPLSDLARKQNELELLEEQLAKDPNNAN